MSPIIDDMTFIVIIHASNDRKAFSKPCNTHQMSDIHRNSYARVNALPDVKLTD